jgi:hypothetical protein
VRARGASSPGAPPRILITSQLDTRIHQLVTLCTQCHTYHNTPQHTLAPLAFTRLGSVVSPLRQLLTRHHSTNSHTGMSRAQSGDEQVRYISPDEVAELILAEPKRDDFLIIGAPLRSSSLSSLLALKVEERADDQVEMVQTSAQPTFREETCPAHSTSPPASSAPTNPCAFSRSSRPSFLSKLPRDTHTHLPLMTSVQHPPNQNTHPPPPLPHTPNRALHALANPRTVRSPTPLPFSTPPFTDRGESHGRWICGVVGAVQGR